MTPSYIDLVNIGFKTFLQQCSVTFVIFCWEIFAGSENNYGINKLALYAYRTPKKELTYCSSTSQQFFLVLLHCRKIYARHLLKIEFIFIEILSF